MSGFGFIVLCYIVGRLMRAHAQAVGQEVAKATQLPINRRPDGKVKAADFFAAGGKL